MKYTKMVLVLSGVMLMLAGCSSANESKKEVQVILDMMAQSGSNYSNVVHGSMQRIAKPAAMVNPAHKTSPVPAWAPVTVQVPINGPVPGYGGSAIQFGNMKMTLYESGLLTGDFMITTTCDHATWGEFVVSGGLTQTGTISGNIYDEIIIQWLAKSGFDYTVNGHSHSINVSGSVAANGNTGVASGSIWGIVDSEYYTYNF
jgi:hypothetical protein